MTYITLCYITEVRFAELYSHTLCAEVIHPRQDNCANRIDYSIHSHIFNYFHEETSVKNTNY